MDIEEMIHDLEVEQERIQDALEVLRRLQNIRKPSSASFDEAEDSAEEISAPETRMENAKASSYVS